MSCLSSSKSTSTHFTHRSDVNTNNSVQRIVNDLVRLSRSSGSPRAASNVAQAQKQHQVASRGAFVSEIEQQILRGQAPVQLNEFEEITVNGERGLWTNKVESANWRGQIPIEQYPINQDTNPEIITKRTAQNVEVINLDFANKITQFL